MRALQQVHTDDDRQSIDLRDGAILGKRYRIENVLASGGMATIYLAHDLSLDRRVALKVLSPELGRMPEVIDHFLNEARVMARLRGPHVARVFDCGRIQHGAGRDLPFMVLELLDGVDLLTALQQATRLGEPLTARYMLETCEGLAEAHALGIVHRDIKPENLFLARQVDGAYTVKLLDFGISKSLDDSRVRSLTTSKDLVGSPLYMSPEQMTAGPIDARTDIWALGAVMYECVAGTPAFGASTVCEICARVLTEPVPDLRQLDVGVSDEFAGIVERCLQRDPANRFQNVVELAAALEPIAGRSGDTHTERTAAVLGVALPEEPAVVAQPEVIAETRDTLHDVGAPANMRRRSGHWALAVFATMLAAGVALGCYGWNRYPVETATVIENVRNNVWTWLIATSRHL